MCGIYGILDLGSGRHADPALAQRMGDVARHRGPDDAGCFAGGAILLGMRRLSIIDVAGGHQPLASADGSIQVVCNGEIYNFRELRHELEAGGVRFATGSDSEVLVHLYARHGPSMVERLDGMFGFAIWDGARQRLVLGRDRLGIKPLYYVVGDGRLVFASEIKSLLQVPGVKAEIDMGSLEQLLYLGYVTGPRTMFRRVSRLPPAHLLIAEKGQLEISRYWSPPGDDVLELADEQAAERVRETLRESVRAQMVADVPLGAFLSGGIDSSAVVGMMARVGQEPPRTYSIGFDTAGAGAYYNELPDARRIAQRFGTEHHEIIVRPDVARLLPKLVWHMDEPLADSAIITTFLVAEFASHSVKVILSGVGGDELLGGYRRYLGPHYLARFNRLPRWLRQRCLRPLAGLLPSDRHGPVTNVLRYAREFIAHAELSPAEQYRAYVRLFDTGERRRLMPGPAAEGFCDPLAAALAHADQGDFVNALMRADMVTQLPDDLLLLTDKMTMAASIECRVPFLSNAMVDLACALPSAIKIRGSGLKYALKAAVRDLLPPETIGKSKRGFGAPVGAWLKRELRPLLGVLLAPDALAQRGLFDPAMVRETMLLHETARRDYSDHLQCLMNLEIWCRIYLDGRSPEDVASEIEERAAARAVA